MPGSSPPREPRERAHYFEDPTPSTTTRGRAQAARERTRRELAEQMREERRREGLNESTFFEWRDENGTRIDIPTILAPFAHAVGVEIAMMKAEVGTVFDAVEDNIAMTSRLVALADTYDEWRKKWDQRKRMAKLGLVLLLAMLVTGLVCGIALCIYVMSGGLNWLAPLVKAAQGG